MTIGMAALSEKYRNAFAHAHPFLEATGDVTLGWLHLKRALTAARALKGKVRKKDEIFYNGVITTARFFIETILPVSFGRMKSVQALSDASLAMDEAAFG